MVSAGRSLVGGVWLVVVVVVVVGAPPTNHPSYILFSHTSVLLGIYSTFVM